MNRIIYCLTEQHDWRFVAGAVALCVMGIGTTIVLLGLARGAPANRRQFYGVIAASILALSVWATHFLAMMGYRTGGEARYDAGVTLASLAIAGVGFAACIRLSMGGEGVARRILSALTGATAVTAMHFVGLSALGVDGAQLILDPGVVAASVAATLALAVVTGATARLKTRWRIPMSTALSAGCVAVLHFGSMSAVSFVPAPGVTATGALTETLLTAWLLVGVAAVVVSAAVVTAVAYWSRSNALSQLREAIEAMPDGLAFYDAQDRLVVWNDRYVEVNPELGPHLIEGARFEDLLRLGLTSDLYIEARGREEAWVAERLAARRESYVTLEQRIEGDHWLRVQDRKTREGGTVTVVSDITALKRDARALAEARDAAEAANRAKSAFLANMSHEIRTPLNGVIGLAQALQRTSLDSEQAEMLDLIQSSGQTLQTLLSDILDLARVESGRVEIQAEAFDLGRAVSQAAQLYAATAAEKGLQFYVEVDPDAKIWVLGDVVRLKQILTNLVSNAVKFTSQGFVSLTVSMGTDAAGATQARFSVTDTGVGFGAEARERLFTRFEQADGTITRRFGGTGLGLAICRQLAELMDGDLDCESEPGGGSTFILSLPVIRTEAPVAAAVVTPAVEDDASGRRMRVLLADDHPTNRRVVELILSSADVDLVSVEDGEQALAAFRTATFDLILMDMQMPVMDGLTTTRDIRRHEQATDAGRTRVVMLTANALPEHIAASEAAGADGHLSKPFSATDLLNLVSDLGDEAAAIAA